ncbi:MAG TPA: EAL domain-containing protein, partial [Acidimicrobiales bacterium]|nr:EAL domain-containing protein [Acidimicrobiales bacterium]
PDMTAALMLQDALEQDLDPAVRRGEFENHYQTVVDVHTGNVVAVETLVRWNHPWAGLIGPSEFIPLAEQTGAIVALGLHVLGNACRDASTWRYMNPDLCVSVNVSALQMTGDTLVEDVRRLLVESELPGEALIVEIREAMAMANLESIRGQLTQLRALGVRIALDGVDTSPGSLAGLDRLPVDMVKIPKKSLDLLEDDEVTIELLDSITDQGLQVVAEGIEEPEQRDVLMAAAGTLAQGYLFSRPVPAHFMTQMLVSDVSRGRAQRPAERTAPPAASRGAAAAV